MDVKYVIKCAVKCIVWAVLYWVILKIGGFILSKVFNLLFEDVEE